MPRTHGYSLKGKRCYGKHNWGAKGRTNVIGALLSGVLLTIGLFETTINTDIFNSWMIQDLIPQLPPNSIIVMDNASFHQGIEMKEALEKQGLELMYTPTYSPDLNPIEKKWAQVKSRRRKYQCSLIDLFNDPGL